MRGCLGFVNWLNICVDVKVYEHVKPWELLYYTFVGVQCVWINNTSAVKS